MNYATLDTHNIVLWYTLIEERAPNYEVGDCFFINPHFEVLGVLLFRYERAGNLNSIIYT